MTLWIRYFGLYRWNYIFCSIAAAECVEKLGQLPNYWTLSADIWSLADLCSVFRGNAIENGIAIRLRATLEICVSHLNKCVRCKARGFICGMCHSGGILFPNFGQVNTLVCSGCGACYHRSCLPRLHPENCPCCLRRQQRQQQEKTSPSSSVFHHSQGLTLVIPSL